ncbi:MAG: DUF3854 domain-containing protein [Chamaesiphon sp. CSU_1_12]|nr:DUF3854 domain-containing protein [Chamaesiphon sp. CSU_1_12]
MSICSCLSIRAIIGRSCAPTPQIRVGITEGAKKAISLTDRGFPCVAILGITNWSVSGSQPRQLLPELVDLASNGRAIDVWFDMENPDERIMAFQNVKAQAWKLTQAQLRRGHIRNRGLCFGI